MATTECQRGHALGAATVDITCFKCGIHFKVPDIFYSVKYSDHTNFWCPNGHQQHYLEGKSEETIQRERADSLNRSLQWEISNHDQTRADRDSIERQRRAEKGAKTRLKNRAAAGVCPCCNRTFKQLAAHMKTKHPAWNKH